MTPYAKLNDILTTNRYIKGTFKGDAPMAKRSKTHFRVTREHNQDLAVRFWNTNIITVSAETGNLTLDCEGWGDRPTTKEAMNTTLNQLLPYRVYLGSRRFKGRNNLVLSTRQGTYLYYDGMVLSPEGNLISEPQPFKARVIDREETAQFAKDIEASGFKDMFRILWGSADIEGRQYARRPVREMITNPTYADEWQHLIAYYAQGMSRGRYTKRDADATWQSIMREAKKFMYTTITTEVTMI